MSDMRLIVAGAGLALMAGSAVASQLVKKDDKKDGKNKPGPQPAVSSSGQPAPTPSQSTAGPALPPTTTHGAPQSPPNRQQQQQQSQQPPQPQRKDITVQPGDTLIGIAEEYETQGADDELLALDRLQPLDPQFNWSMIELPGFQPSTHLGQDPNRIMPGDIIRIG